MMLCFVRARNETVVCAIFLIKSFTNALPYLIILKDGMTLIESHIIII